MFRFGDQKLGNFLLAQKLEDLVALKNLIEAGKVIPVMDRAFALSEAREAIDHVATGHASGKVAITVSRASSEAAGAAPIIVTAPVALPAVA